MVINAIILIIFYLHRLEYHWNEEDSQDPVEGELEEEHTTVLAGASRIIMLVNSKLLWKNILVIREEGE